MILVALMALAASGPPHPLALPRGCRDRACVRQRAVGSDTAVTPPQFAFAPANGAGMGTACACTTPTGSKGETLTFTRASSGACMKAGRFTNIATGDLVTCTTDQARVSPGGDGTGPLGLLVESARTNTLLNSEAINNASFSNFATGAAAPTITADAAAAPDGTTTADRMQIPLTTSVQVSARYYAVSLSGAASASIFLMGNGGTSGITDLCLFNNTSGAYVCIACTFTGSAWTRCVNPNVPSGSLNGTWLFGNASNLNGNTARAAVDVLVWGGQWEVGGNVSSYIKTSGSTVTRAKDVASFTPPSQSGSTVSLAATWTTPSTTASNVLLHLYKDSNNSTKLSIASAKVRGTFRIGGSDSTQDSSGSVTVSVNNAASAYYDATNKAGCLAGVCNTAAASLTLPTGSQTLYIGADQAGANQADGVVKLVCLDPSPTRCQ